MLLAVRHVVKLQPVRVSYYNTELRVNALHLIGYRAVCECGERSKVKRSRRELRTWSRAHHEHERQTSEGQDDAPTGGISV